MDLQEMLKKVVSLESKLVQQAKEIELQSDEIKRLKQIISNRVNTTNNNTPIQLQYSFQREQENVQQYNRQANGLAQSREPRRYSREILTNIRYSTGANYASSFTMNPMVHPPSAIPPMKMPAQVPMAGIVNIHPPQPTLANNNNSSNNTIKHSNNNHLITKTNYNTLKLKPSRLHVTSLPSSRPLTSNGSMFEPSLTVNGFDNEDQDHLSKQGSAHNRQSFVESMQNESASASVNPFAPTPPLSQPEAANQRASKKPLDLKPRENDDPCRCPILYSTNPPGSSAEYAVGELTTERQKESSEKKSSSNSHAEKVRLITVDPLDKRFKIISDTESQNLISLQKPRLNLNEWPPKEKLKSDSAGSPAKKIKINLKSPFTMYTFLLI